MPGELHDPVQAPSRDARMRRGVVLARMWQHSSFDPAALDIYHAAAPDYSIYAWAGAGALVAGALLWRAFA